MTQTMKFLMSNLHNTSRRMAVAAAALAASTLGFAQVPGSALDYMLQRPRVAKSYSHKRAFDHLFVDLGAGVNAMGTRPNTRMGMQGALGVGDWITPEHGVRLGLETGLWRIYGKKVKYADLSLDYLINITAIAAPGTTYTPRRFELIGVFGVDYARSLCEGNWDGGFGVHMGMRGQLALSRFAYAYLEPRMGLIDDNAPQTWTEHGYRPYLALSLGFGCRLPEVRTGGTPHTAHGFSDGLFLSLLGGPSMLANSHPSTWDGRLGGRVALSVGKWFDSYSALRLTANATSIDQYNSTNHIKALGLQLDYMANLHNVFGGPLPARRFWIDAVAGISVNRSADDNLHPLYSFGVGGGLQANVRLSRSLALTLEPRIDVYADRYAPHTSSFHSYDVVPSLLAGFTYTYNNYVRSSRDKASNDIRRSTIGIVGGLANRITTLDEPRMYAPLARLSYTRWYSPTFAWRANVQGMMRGRSSITGQNFGQLLVGGDWLADLTALSRGYDRQRVLAFKTIAGFGIGADYSRTAQHNTYFSSDVHVGGQMSVRVGNGLHVVAEPMVYCELSRRLDPERVGRCVPSIAVGLEYDMRHSENRRSEVEKPGRRNFVSAAVGTGFCTASYGEMGSFGNRLSLIGEVAYGHWLDGINGVHASIANSAVKRGWSQSRQNITSLSAGYMMNMKAAVKGEQTDDDVFQLTGIADLSLAMSTHKDKDAKLTWGGKLAVQAGFRVSRSVELYVEPSAVVYGKNVDFTIQKHHPFEGEARLTAGAKFNF